METLRQTLVVPKNHRLHLDVILPESFPSGTTDVLLIFSPKTSPETQAHKHNELLKLAGSLKTSRNFGGDPLKIQKALRDEWQ